MAYAQCRIRVNVGRESIGESSRFDTFVSNVVLAAADDDDDVECVTCMIAFFAATIASNSISSNNK
jgi:catabolite regulation protein CreA